MKPVHAVALMTTFALLPLSTPALDQSPATAPAPAPETGLPAGVIVMWSGQLDAIPDGWVLCDGQNGTPDLSNRFVLGAHTAEYLGSTGGSRTHQHRSREHSHQIDPPATRLRPFTGYSAYGGTRTGSRYYMLPGQTFDLRPFKSDPSAVTTDAVSNLPPYYKIAFIIKL